MRSEPTRRNQHTCSAVRMDRTIRGASKTGGGKNPRRSRGLLGRSVAGVVPGLALGLPLLPLLFPLVFGFGLVVLHRVHIDHSRCFRNTGVRYALCSFLSSFSFSFSALWASCSSCFLSFSASCSACFFSRSSRLSSFLASRSSCLFSRAFLLLPGLLLLVGHFKHL